MDRVALIRDLMVKVNKAFNRYRGAATYVRDYQSISFTVPGLSTTDVCAGVPVSDIIIPQTTLPPEVRFKVLVELMPCLADLQEARLAMLNLLGRQLTDFAMLANTSEGVLLRLLWVFKQGVPVEIDGHSLVLNLNGNLIGVKGGVLVGGPFDGVPISVSMGDLLATERVVTTKAAKVIEVRRVLRDHVDAEAFNAFCILYAISEWDATLPLASVTLPLPSKSVRSLEKISSHLLTTKDPYNYLYRALVPYYMPYTSFIATFGRPSRRGNIGQRARIRLINKVGLLPFLK